MLERLYLFQGNMLLIPDNVPESLFFRGVPIENLASFPIQVIDVPPLLSYEICIKMGDVPLDAPLPPQWRRIPVKAAISFSSLYEENENMVRAFHIAQWRRESVFCGTCGSKNSDAENETARICPHCGRVEYPRIAPAIIVLIINNEGKILLAHNTEFKDGVYSLIAGFNEAGETLEQTVEREVFEETGLKVKKIRYILSRPWPFPASLMTGWRAEYAEGDLKPDGVEIKDVGWFGKDALPVLPPAGSLAQYLIDRWLAGEIV